MELTAEVIQERMQSPHLDIPENEEELRKDVEESLEKDPATPDKAKDDARLKPEFTFALDYTDSREKVWKGEFTNKILSIRERQMAGIMRARLGGGMPAASIDSLTGELNLIVSHLAFSLTSRPDWAKNLQALDDVELLQKVYSEVASHEATFFGWDADAGSEDLRK